MFWEWRMFELKKKFCLLYFMIVFLWMPMEAMASTMRISNPKIELELSPGETYSGEITLENPADEEVKARLYLEDWMYAGGGTGEKKFTPAASTPLSASQWITFNPVDSKLLPFGRLTARYTVTVPAAAKGAYYSVLFFETMLGATVSEEGASVLVAARIGSLFFIQVKGTIDRSGQVQSVQIDPPQGNKPMEIITVFKNTGNVDITLGGNLLIMDSEGKMLGRGGLNKIYTFPQSTASGKTQWIGRLPKGKYQLLITYDLGKGKTEVKEEALLIS